jgi:hypothetical protein
MLLYVHKRPLLINIDRILSTLLIILVSPANDVCHQLISLATMLGLSFKNCVLRGSSANISPT